MKDLIDSPERAECLAERRATPGIVVLTSARRFLYMNRQGRELCRHLVWTEGGRLATGLLPKVVTELRDEIVTKLESLSHVKDWENIEISRVVGDSHKPVLLRGLGFPDPTSPNPACVLVLIEEVGRDADLAPAQAKLRFRLTDREEAAIQYLAKGFTNKEIADALGISEPTVKEHLRHIMQKTGTHTRTGVLARVLAS
jgi:DNA-binding CsgD family transcriptional regulator